MKPPKTERESPPADPSPGPPSLIPRSARARVPRPRRSAAAGPMPSRARQQRGLQLWVSAGPVAAAKPRQEKRTVRVSSSPWGGGGRGGAPPGRSPLTVSCAPAASAGRSGPPAREGWGRGWVPAGAPGDSAASQGCGPPGPWRRPPLPAGPSPEARLLSNRRLGSLRVLPPHEV